MSKCKITGKVLVIQLGRDETRIALMSSASEILHRVTLPTPAGAVEDGVIQNADAVHELLAGALAMPEFKGARKAVFSLCTSQVVTEQVTTPQIPAAKLEKLLQANVDMYFPMDMNDYRMVWKVIGPKQGEGALKELDVQLWAVPTAMLARYYSVANACGLSVAAIDYCGHSAATAALNGYAPKAAKQAKAPRERVKLDLRKEITFGKKKQETAEETAVAVAEKAAAPVELHLMLDSDLIIMTFIQNGRVVLQRPVQGGAHPSHQLGELAMMVEYFRSLEIGRGSEVRGILSGPLANDYQLVGELTDVLGIPVSVMEANYEPQWVICAGAARTTLDFGVPSLNRPGKAAGKLLESQIWQYALVLAGGAALVAVIAITLSARLIWNSSLSSLETTKNALTIQAAQSAGYADNYERYSSAYTSYSADWDTVFASLRTYNDNLVLVLKELEATLPESSSVTALQIATDGIAVQFACASKEEAAYLIMALRELTYSDLVSISNLSGGGGGAATSYGSGTEAAPTEGSYELSQADLDAIIQLMAGTVTQEDLMEVALSLTPEQLERLETTYGKEPSADYLYLTNFMSGNAVTETQRANAVHEMLTANPFAMELFAEQLMADTERSMEDALLWPYLLEDFMLEENQDMVNALFDGTIADDPEQLGQYMERLVAMLVKNETTLSATEELICADRTLEQWYIYYLEVEAGLREAEVYPYLNMEKVIEDVMAGGFDTGDEALDALLGGLIPEDVWELLQQLENSGSGEDGPVIDPTILAKYTEDELKTLVLQYYLTGSTGDEELDALIAYYLKLYQETGSTGVDRLDELLNQYFGGSTGDGTGSGTGDSLGDLLGSLLGGGTTTGGTVTASDTRIYFTVSLSYNDELKNAELVRKGLDYSDKIEKVEVAD